MNQKKNEAEDNRPRKKSSLESFSEAYREISPYLNISYFFLAAIGLLAWIGYHLDKLWGSSPWGLVGGAILGIVIGFYNFFKTVSGSFDKKKQK
jgi:F0F1-type ATP synthase assembly protein I